MRLAEVSLRETCWCIDRGVILQFRLSTDGFGQIFLREKMQANNFLVNLRNLCYFTTLSLCNSV